MMLGEIIIFVVVLIVLIVVHELGHFFVAKWTGMKVEEFGLGYPPKVFGIKKGETEYTLNALPFGGFVKIFGEDLGSHEASPRAFGARPKWAQALVLVAGVAMNVLLAWVILIVLFATPTERALSEEEIQRTPGAELAITELAPGSPAQKAGLMSGDKILSVSRGETRLEHLTVDEFIAFTSKGGEMKIGIERKGTTENITATPEPGIIPGEPDRPGLGVSLGVIGVAPLSLVDASVEATKATWGYLTRITIGLFSFIASALTLSADLALVSGPVGIATVVGDASEQGIAPLLFLTAIISLNLAVLNLLPFPALDGGRLLFVLIEAVFKKPVPASIANATNTIGFFALIILMVLVTVSDISKLIG
jgi:regulator of sigma E protease